MREKASIVLLRDMARFREQTLAYTCEAGGGGGEGGKEENNLESSLAGEIRKGLKNTWHQVSSWMVQFCSMQSYRTANLIFAFKTNAPKDHSNDKG